MKNWIIYSISLQGEIKYIGKTCRFEQRKKSHLNRRGTYNSAIPIDVDLSLIDFDIVCESYDREEAFKLENKYILEYQTLTKFGGWNRMRSGLNRAKMTTEYIEEKKEYGKKYEKEHRKERQEKQNQRRRNNKEEYNKKQREYYANNHEKKLLYHRQWRAKKKAEKLTSA